MEEIKKDPNGTCRLDKNCVFKAKILAGIQDVTVKHYLESYINREWAANKQAVNEAVRN